MPILNVTQDEWTKAKEKANRDLEDKLRAHPHYTGVIKVDRKDFDPQLAHSFMVNVVNGEMQHIVAKARKSMVTEGKLGEGAFGVCIVVQTEEGIQMAMKIQGQKTKKKIDAAQLQGEMTLLKAVGDLYGEGVIEKQNEGEHQQVKHYSLMKLKQGSELFKQIYLPVDYATMLARYHIGIPSMDMGDNKYVSRKDNFTPLEQHLLAVKCLEGIKFLHDRNIVHRDIKPQNFLARYGDGTKSDIIIISPIDFGLSHQLRPDETSRHGVGPAGTRGYAAPEVFSGVLRKSNDIFSLGMMLQKDFGINDVFIYRMIRQAPSERPSIEECIEYFRSKLKDEITKNLEQTPMVEQQAEEKMQRLLASEEELIRELETQNQPSIIQSGHDSLVPNNEGVESSVSEEELIRQPSIIQSGQNPPVLNDENAEKNDISAYLEKINVQRRYKNVEVYKKFMGLGQFHKMRGRNEQLDRLQDLIDSAVSQLKQEGSIKVLSDLMARINEFERQLPNTNYRLGESRLENVIYNLKQEIDAFQSRLDPNYKTTIIPKPPGNR